VWEGLNASLAEGLDLEQRLGMRLERFSTAAGLRYDADRTRPRRRSIPVNTVNFISIPGSIVPDQEVLVFGQNRLTYAALNELVARIATVFKKLGLKQRDVSRFSIPTRICMSPATMRPPRRD